MTDYSRHILSLDDTNLERFIRDWTTRSPPRMTVTAATSRTPRDNYHCSIYVLIARP